MKLAEALILRADCQKRIQQLETRLTNNAMVQDGEAPAEDPSQLRSELEDILEQLLLLVKHINRTNSLNQVDEGLTFSDALANRDILHLKHGIYRNLAQAATVTQTLRRIPATTTAVFVVCQDQNNMSNGLVKASAGPQKKVIISRQDFTMKDEGRSKYDE